MPSVPEYRFQSLIFSVAVTRISTPTVPVVDVMICSTDGPSSAGCATFTAWASRAPIRPITYSPTVKPMIVWITTSRLLRLNLVRSGVITAPTMNPPATSRAPVSTVSSSPCGADVARSPIEWSVSADPIDQPARIRNSGTAMYAVHFIEPMPQTTIAVTATPNRNAQPATGSTPTSECSPSADASDWMPNQPRRLSAITSPKTDKPKRPKPVHRASSDVCRPSCCPMKPTTIETTSSTTAPMVMARNARQRFMPKPSVAPSRNWLSAESWPNRCMAIDHQG